MRRAKTAGITVAFNHNGVAVLLMPAATPEPTVQAPSAAPGAGSSSPL